MNWIIVLGTHLSFSLNAFTEIAEFSDQNNIHLKKRLLYLELAISCIRNQSLYLRHQEVTGNRRISLNWSNCMLQWFLRFSEFTEFIESSAPFKENSIGLQYFTEYRLPLIVSVYTNGDWCSLNENSAIDVEYLKSSVKEENQTGTHSLSVVKLFHPKCISFIHSPLQWIFINFQVCLLQFVSQTFLKSDLPSLLFIADPLMSATLLYIYF